MSKLIFLGTSNAIPDETHENTHMVVVGETRTILVDCATSPLLRLKKAGVDYRSVTDIILTHFHPDHVGGIPQFLMTMWLMGRKDGLTLHGLDSTLDKLEQMMESYGWSKWPNFYSVSLHRLPTKEMALVLECDEMTILSAQVKHMIPTIGLRIEFKKADCVIAYSCDTEPCDQVIDLAKNAKVLIHEASGNSLGHTSAFQAGEIATQARVEMLYLIHYPTGDFAIANLVEEAGKSFHGPVFQAVDFMELIF